MTKNSVGSLDAGERNSILYILDARAVNINLNTKKKN